MHLLDIIGCAFCQAVCGPRNLLKSGAGPCYRCSQSGTAILYLPACTNTCLLPSAFSLLLLLQVQSSRLQQTVLPLCDGRLSDALLRAEPAVTAHYRLCQLAQSRYSWLGHCVLANMHSEQVSKRVCRYLHCYISFAAAGSTAELAHGSWLKQCTHRHVGQALVGCVQRCKGHHAFCGFQLAVRPYVERQAHSICFLRLIPVSCPVHAVSACWLLHTSDSYDSSVLKWQNLVRI